MPNKRIWWAIASGLVIASMLLAACAPAEPKVIEREVEVTRIVEGESETIVVTATPEAEEETALPDVIKIGVLDSMTGPHSAYGLGVYDGIKLAAKEYPEVLGRPIELVVADTKSDKSESALAAERLVEEGVVASLGTATSSFSMAANEVYHDFGIPSVSATSTNPLVTLDKPYAFRVCFIDPFQGYVLAKFAIEELEAKTAVLLVEITTDYSVGLANFFREAWYDLTDDKESLLGYYSLMYGDTDFTGQLQAIKELNPDVICAPDDYKEVALMVQQAQDLGITAKFLSGDGVAIPEFAEIAGPPVDNVYFSGHFHPDATTGEVSQRFIEAFREEYGRDPDTMSATGYDSYLVLRDAIERAGSVDGDAIRDALAATQDFEGASGSISIDSNGNAVKSAVVMGFEDQESYLVTVVNP
jgi:branched-chain amino acid transport system substrate-binding protein